jgi:hypothetical protein
MPEQWRGETNSGAVYERFTDGYETTDLGAPWGMLDTIPTWNR